MGNNTITPKYERVVQLLLIIAAVLTPYLAFTFMDLELFSVSKTIFITLWSSTKPWLCPPYIYLLINFIIFIIVASSSYHSDHTNQPPATESSLVTQTLASEEALSNDDLLQPEHLIADRPLTSNNTYPTKMLVNSPLKFQTFKDLHVDDERSKEVSPEISAVDKKELRKSKTFNVSESRASGRRERYVRILSQDELDRRVEAFIYRFKKEMNVEKQ